MKKKEVIFYDGNAFPSLGETLELKAGNKRSVSGMGYMQEIQLTEKKIKNFWKKIDEFGVWNWHSKYPDKEPKYQPPTCQVNWRLKIINHDKAKYCSGYYFFPRNFKKFTKELSDLMGVEIEIQS